MSRPVRNVADVPVHGRWEARFDPVVEVFRENLASRGDLGASFAATEAGELVVDVWGGWRAPDRTTEWSSDTVVNVFSTTKGIAALAAHLLIDKGAIDLDAPVADYWPEFARAGKAEIPVRYVLGHLAGLPGLRDPIRRRDLYDWDRMCERLANEEPWYEPGSNALYHAMTFGHLVGELVRRVSGIGFGQFVRERIAGAMDCDFQIGLAETDYDRASDVRTPIQLPGHRPWPGHEPAAGPVRVDRLAAIANTREWRQAEIPSVNGHGNARSLAKIYAALANGGAPLVSGDAIERMRERQLGTRRWEQRPDGAASAWACGFMPNWTFGVFGPSEGAFGHTGFGGSFAACDPERRVSVAFAMNQLADERFPDERGERLVRAFYGALSR